LFVPYKESSRIFEIFEYQKEILEYSVSSNNIMLFKLDITEEDFLRLRLQYGNNVWER
jgi:hypothetical protein